MYPPNLSLHDLADALRAGRHAEGLSIAELAEQAGVSPRLVSEFENGKRPNVSLETALRLLALVHIPLAISPAPTAAAALRVAARRRTWTAWKGTRADQDAPAAPSKPADRLAAVARASRLAVGLRKAARLSPQ